MGCAWFGGPEDVDTCWNQRDDDGDGLVDSNDPGCTTQGLSTLDRSERDPSLPCDDGVDNDGDTLADNQDPGCFSPTDTSESQDGYLCDNGVDDDVPADGLVDMADPGCSSPSDFDERPDCSDGVDIDRVVMAGGVAVSCIRTASPITRPIRAARAPMIPPRRTPPARTA